MTSDGRKRLASRLCSQEILDINGQFSPDGVSEAPKNKKKKMEAGMKRGQSIYSDQSKMKSRNSAGMKLHKIQKLINGENGQKVNKAYNYPQK